jgi:very-short-patch-repair endonuclease
VDGGVHRGSIGSMAADRRRDEWLRRRGFRVARVSAALVLRSPEEALANIRSAPVLRTTLTGR